MTKLTFHELLNDYRHLLDDKTYVRVFDFYIGDGINASELQDLLFSEEGDWFYDTSADKADRARGISPMSKEYTDKKNAKRIALGVSPLTPGGNNPDNTSKEFCEAIIKNSPKHRHLK